MSRCPTDAKLAELLSEVSFDLDMDEIETHLSYCIRCQARVEAWVGFPNALVSALRTAAPLAFQDEPACGQLVVQMAGFALESELPSVAPSVAVPALPETLGIYTVAGVIAEGGMGTIYRAVDPQGTPVAVKVMRAGRITPETVARFKQELRVIAQLKHPGIVTALAEGEVAGAPYLVMEFVDGIDLSQLSHACGRLEIADACELVRQAAEGLQYSFEFGVIHRDIKPSNLMLARQPDGGCRVKILDLGLVRFAQPGPQDGLTISGQVMGTLDYMSPEQALNSRRVDIRSDIYSLGATLWKLLTGCLLAKLHPTAVLEAMHRPPTSPALGSDSTIRLLSAVTIPPALLELLERMTAWNPKSRMQTPQEVAAALAPWSVGHHIDQLLSAAARQRSEVLKSPVPAPTTVPVGAVAPGETQRFGSPRSQPATAAEVEAPPVKNSRRTWLAVVACLAGGAGLLPLTAFRKSVPPTPAERPAAKPKIQPPAQPGAQPEARSEAEVTLELNDIRLEVALTGSPAEIPLLAGRPTVVPIGRYQLAVRGLDGNALTDPFQIPAPVGEAGADPITTIALRIIAGPRSVEVLLGSQWLGLFPLGNQDRSVADWVCQQGGTVVLSSQSGSRSVHTRQNPEIPVEFTQLDSISLSPLPWRNFPNSPANAPEVTAFDTLALASKLEGLALREVPLTDAGWQRMARFRSLRGLHSLTLDQVDVSNAAISTLQAFPDLYALDLRNLPIIDDAALSELGQHPTLGCLQMVRTGVTGKNLEALPWQKLGKLALNHCPLRPTEFPRIVHLRHLQELNLNDSPVEDTWLPALQRLPQLHTLELARTRVTNAGLKTVGTMLSLRNLDLSNLPLSGVGLAHLRSLPLVRLSLAGTGIGDADLALLDPQALDRLDLMETEITDVAIESLAKSTKLKDVRLGNTRISSAGLGRLKQLLPNCDVR